MHTRSRSRAFEGIRPRVPSLSAFAVAGLMILLGATSCRGRASGGSCEAAGGTCVPGNVPCGRQAPPNGQDCNTSPADPGGGVCCLDLAQDAGAGRDSGGEAGSADAAATETGTTSCVPVVPSDYDQSCAVDSDCVAVGSVSSCPPSACDGCTTEAINRRGAPQYMAALAAAFASAPAGACGCPCESGAICRAGQCQAAFCGPPRTDTLPTCADAGGLCYYTATTTCSAVGPMNSCSYDDETCCVP